jgi:hypothetical protein
MKPSPLVALGISAGIVAATASAQLAAAGPAPTTVDQLCAAQQWPRSMPDVVGKNLDQVTGQGALACWDNVRGVAPDGHDPVGNATDAAGYLITAVSPPPGTPAGRHDAVTVQLTGVDRQAPPASRPATGLPRTKLPESSVVRRPSSRCSMRPVRSNSHAPTADRRTAAWNPNY